MTAIRATEAEAFDYLPKPFDLPDLMQRAARALKIRRRRTRPSAGGIGGAPKAAPEGAQTASPGRARAPGAEAGALTSDLPLIGQSPPMQRLYKLIAQVIHTDLPVLIQGASGTGKSGRRRSSAPGRLISPMRRRRAISCTGRAAARS